MIAAESVLASLSIIREAGGTISDQHGKPLRPIRNLTKGFSLVVAGTRQLHEELLERINSQRSILKADRAVTFSPSPSLMERGPGGEANRLHSPFHTIHSTLHYRTVQLILH